MMGLGLPMLSAIIARLPNAEINLAAYGGIVQPISLFFAAPLIMLLSASTALSKDWESYLKLRRFMLSAGTILTLTHLLIVFTPLYYLVVENIIGAPHEIIEPARTGLMITAPWSLAVGFRRFQQGVMIRFGYSKAVGIGTITRFLANLTVLLIGFSIKTIPGVLVASFAQILGLICEAIYSAIRVRPILRNELKMAPPTEPLTWRGFTGYYIPLAMTTMLIMLWQPIGTAAISRMPNPLTSLAIWPVLYGSMFILRSPGMSFNEVVVALIDKPGAWKNMRRFTIILISGTTLLFFLIAGTPLALMWFRDISALPLHLTELALNAYWFALPIPALNVLRSWFQGTILTSKQTRGIPESVVVSLSVFIAILAAGILWGDILGLYIAINALSLGTFGQTVWLWYRSRSTARSYKERDQKLILSRIS
jgi:hypothetical protein